MLFQDDVPKSNRRVISVVSRGFEESAVRFWSPLHGLEKFSVNKQFFEDSILSVQFIQPTYMEGGPDFSSGWTRLPLKIKCWWDNFLQIQIIQCKHLASKIMWRTWHKYRREKSPSQMAHLCPCPNAAVDTLMLIMFLKTSFTLVKITKRQNNKWTCCQYSKLPWYYRIYRVEVTHSFVYNFPV